MDPMKFALPPGRLTSMVATLCFLAALTAGIAAAAFPSQETAGAASNQGLLPQNFSAEQMANFLRHARIIGSKESQKGRSATSRLTLSDGITTHDASFQSINEFATVKKMDNGTTEINFRDSYHFNIAAYEIARLLGIGNMMPVTIERRWNGKPGSFSWWLPIMMDEADRYEKRLSVPNPDAWNKQMHKVRVFSELVYDTDRNLTNVLIDKDWNLYMIDFSRAFRLRDELKSPQNLVKCDRRLFDRLQQLSEEDVVRVTRGHLTKSEIKALMERRKKIVSFFQKLIAEKGDNEVLYE